MENFRHFIKQSGLMDLDLNGCKYTWVSNPREGFVTREKLDRVFLNWPCRNLFQHAIAEALPMISLDHSPIFLRLKPKGRSDRVFKYEAFWEDHEDCRNIVTQGWLKGDGGDNVWRALMNKTNTCRKELVAWQRRTFQNADEEIRRSKARLEELLNGG